MAEEADSEAEHQAAPRKPRRTGQPECSNVASNGEGCEYSEGRRVEDPKDYVAFDDRNPAPQTTFGSPANRVHGSVALRPWVTPGLPLSGVPRLLMYHRALLLVLWSFKTPSPGICFIPGPINDETSYQ